ncbi:hypothetical protein [Legionella santicrucis]|nr:hypothetical protein [Legionella santicrucis]
MKPKKLSKAEKKALQNKLIQAGREGDVETINICLESGAGIYVNEYA